MKRVFVAAAVLLPLVAGAQIRLSGVFSDHMVLQREMPVPVWGAAAPGDTVTVKFSGQVKTVTADSAGKWMANLDPMRVRAEPQVMTVSSSNSGARLLISDVLVGEVWLGCGESNMQMELSRSIRDEERLQTAIDRGPYPFIRLLSSTGGDLQWREGLSPNIKRFSALLFMFGRRLQSELNIPVGLMVGAEGGTPSALWLSESALAADATCRELMKRGKVGHLFETRIRPLIPFAIRGVLWDQGESGTGLPGIDQATLMGALIRGWRAEWAEAAPSEEPERAFPFIYVQKPSGGGCAWDPTSPVTPISDAFERLPPKMPEDGALVENCIKIMRYPNTAMVISSDLGSGFCPTNKSGYGHRASSVALGTVYSNRVEYYGPVYESHVMEGSKVRVRFTHVGRGLAFRHAETLQGFAIAGADRVFHWADAEIEEDTVVVHSEKVSKPAAVRYAWSIRRPWANLFNKDKLPALPFRTDNWPVAEPTGAGAP